MRIPTSRSRARRLRADLLALADEHEAEADRLGPTHPLARTHDARAAAYEIAAALVEITFGRPGRWRRP